MEVHMQLEDSNGKVTHAKSEEDVKTAVAQIGETTDHCILHDNDSFIQAAGEPSNLHLEYRDSSGYYEADEALSRQRVAELFAAFFRKDSSWKTQCAFSPIQETSQQRKHESLSDTVIGSIQGELKNSFSRMLRRGVRRIFRKIF